MASQGCCTVYGLRASHHILPWSQMTIVFWRASERAETSLPFILPLTQICVKIPPRCRTSGHYILLKQSPLCWSKRFTGHIILTCLTLDSFPLRRTMTRTRSNALATVLTFLKTDCCTDIITKFGYIPGDYLYLLSTLQSAHERLSAFHTQQLHHLHWISV